MESIWEVDIARTRARTRRKVKGKKKREDWRERGQREPQRIRDESDLQRFVHGRRRRRETKNGELGSESWNYIECDKSEMGDGDDWHEADSLPLPTLASVAPTSVK